MKRDEDEICGEMMTLSQLQKKLNHTSLALLKIDVEGFEIPLFRSWWVGAEAASMPTQVLVEVHYYTFVPFASIIQNKWMKKYNPDKSADNRKLIQNGAELVTLNQQLLEMGYVVVAKDNNSLCQHCIEAVLIRVPPKELLEKKHYHLDRK